MAQENQKNHQTMAIENFTHERWLDDEDKDNENYYRNWQFKMDYQNKNMLPHANACYNLICGQVKAALHTKVAQSINGVGVTMRILSLGCGPGTDLLAAIWACNSIGGVRRFECTGVDKVCWPFDVFNSQVGYLRDVDVQSEFVERDSVFYVKEQIKAAAKFDLVISCHARARSKLTMLGKLVPQILSKDGRIFVIDNNCLELRNGLRKMGGSVQANQWNDGNQIFYVFKTQQETNA